MQTLEFFGLPADYSNGNGHNADWDKNKDADKKKKGNKKIDLRKVNITIKSLKKTKNNISNIILTT